MKRIPSVILSVLCLFSLASCTDLVEIDSPKNQLSTDKVFADTLSAKAALLNIYPVLESQQYNNCNKYLSVYADETISLNSEPWTQSRLSADESATRANWTYLYSAIFQCNMILERLESSDNLSPAFKSKTAAEARFLRAYGYHYLLNLYDRVPLILSTDVERNRKAAQNSPEEVYTQIVDDLQTARADLPAEYQGGGKVRANQAAALALLARVSLYQKNWALAESLSDQLISAGAYTPLDAPPNVFKASSRESILQIATQNGFSTETPGVVSATATTVPAYYLTESFYSSFETGDVRKSSWIGTNTNTVNGVSTVYRYPFKYKNRTANTTSPENLVVLRLAEQYLIRAEARAYLGKLTGQGSAAEDLNVIRARAGLMALQPANLPDMLEAIYNERRHEFFFENADRFMDLKRTGRLHSVLSAVKPTWLTTSVRLPIPSSDILTNSNLIQNEGY